MSQGNEHTCERCGAMRAKTAALMNENLRLHADLRAAEETIALHRREAKRVLHDSCQQERTHRLDENVKLLNLHVASLRLHEVRARHEVLEAIQEIVVNLIGSEELAVFELSPDGTELYMVSSFGIDPSQYSSIASGVGIIGQVAKTGRAFVRTDFQSREPEETPAERDLTACVPLKLCGRVVGALAMFRLLEQKKSRLVDLDREILELVSMQAAPSLYSAQLMAG